MLGHQIARGDGDQSIGAGQDGGGVCGLCKQNPGKLNFGSAGTGGTIHLAGEMFSRMAGVDTSTCRTRARAPRSPICCLATSG